MSGLVDGASGDAVDGGVGAAIVIATGVGAGGGTVPAAVPFRERHDGWTKARRDRFVARLAETGCVQEACRTVGLSTTSAYRTFARIAAFRAEWEAALRARRPMLEDAAFARAVHGVEVPIVRQGRVVARRLRYSDALLRFLIERSDRLAAAAAAAAAGAGGGGVAGEELDHEALDREFNRRLDQVAAAMARAADEKVVAGAAVEGPVAGRTSG